MIRQLEAVILPLKFQCLPFSHGGLVYGKIVKPDVSLRLYTWMDEWGNKNPLDQFLLKFFTRKADGIKPVGSERRVPTHQLKPEVWGQMLREAIGEWELQLSQTDPVCNKCHGGGVYRWKKGMTECSGPCNRCGGKGYQDFNDRRRNFGYDRHVKEVAETVDPLYPTYIPHWTPDPDNLK